MTRLGLTYLRNIGGPNGAFVLNPTGHVDSISNHFWNASAACCNRDGTVIDDVTYIKNMVAYFIAQGWPIDPKQVFAVGHSNGDFMTERLLCDASDVFAAGAGLAGAARDTQGQDARCTPANHFSYRHAHGTSDSEVTYSVTGNIGGMSSTYPAVEVTNGTMDQIRTAVGCTGSTLTATGNTYDYDTNVAGSETTEYKFAGCPAGYDVYLEKMAGSPHDPSYGGAHPLASAFATDLVAFLLAHPKP
jgi:polyhydroxybutyrate depolymerase